MPLSAATQALGSAELSPNNMDRNVRATANAIGSPIPMPTRPAECFRAVPSRALRDGSLQAPSVSRSQSFAGSPYTKQSRRVRLRQGTSPSPQSNRETRNETLSRDAVVELLPLRDRVFERQIRIKPCTISLLAFKHRLGFAHRMDLVL